MAEDTPLEEKKPRLDSVIRSLAKRGFFLFVKVVDKYASNRLRSIVIAAADEYVPDEVANSRKVCTVLAGVGKYIPDEVIPPESTERWENLRTKFHIPKLISSRPK